MFQVFWMWKTFIIRFYNVLQQFRVKSMVSIPLLWALFLMSGHDIRSWADISQDSVGGKKVVREVWGNLLICFLIQWAQKIWFGRRIRSKEPTLVSCPDISKWDIPWIRWGKRLGAWPLCLKIIIRHILIEFLLKIDTTKATYYSRWSAHEVLLNIEFSLLKTNLSKLRHLRFHHQ